MLTVPVLRPEVAREYAKYEAACEEYNRQRMEEMRKPVPGAAVCMAYAHAAPRCAHVRADGLRCSAPALRGRRICYAHTRMLATRQAGLKLPALEDAAGITLATMQVVQQMLDGKLDRKMAATALYGIQIVASTLNHRPFAVHPTSVVMEAEGLPPEEELLQSEIETTPSDGTKQDPISKEDSAEAPAVNSAPAKDTNIEQREAASEQRRDLPDGSAPETVIAERRDLPRGPEGMRPGAFGGEATG